MPAMFGLGFGVSLLLFGASDTMASKAMTAPDQSYQGEGLDRSRLVTLLLSGPGYTIVVYYTDDSPTKTLF